MFSFTIKPEYLAFLDFSRVNSTHVVLSKPPHVRPLGPSQGVEGTRGVMYNYEFTRFGKLRLYPTTTDPMLANRYQNHAKEVALRVFRRLVEKYLEHENARVNTIKRALRRGFLLSKEGNTSTRRVLNMPNMRNLVLNQYKTSNRSNVNRALANNNAVF